MKPDPGGAPQRSAPDGQPFPGTTELSADLSFGEPRPFKFGSETDSPRRAGHVIFKLSSPVPASGYDRHHGQSHVKLGTGYEISGLARVQAALPWEVKVEDGTRGLELKDSVQRLCDPLNTCTPGRGKHRPCRPYRCVCPAPLLHVEWQPPLPWSLRRGQPPVCVRLDVWLQPDIFDMRISAWGSQRSCFFDVWQLMDRIVPSHRPIPRPRPPPVQGGAQALTPAGAATGGVQPAGPPGAYAFTLAGLMRALESAGYPEMEQPDGLKLTLFQFQRQSLQWMYDRETDVGGLNALFWEERPSDAGGVDRSGAPADHRFYYNPMAGELRSEPLPVVSGGFLCEEMGLGKTVEMCARVLANKDSRAAADAGRAVLTTGAALPPHSRATLVVCPVTLLAQWRREIAKCSGDTLKVLPLPPHLPLAPRGYGSSFALSGAHLPRCRPHARRGRLSRPARREGGPGRGADDLRDALPRGSPRGAEDAAPRALVASGARRESEAASAGRRERLVGVRRHRARMRRAVAHAQLAHVGHAGRLGGG